MIRKAAVLISASVALLGAGEALASGLPTEFTALARACAPNVHPVTLAAVVSQESGGNPYAIGVNRGTARLKRQPVTAQEAIEAATLLKAQGHDFDGGLAQINVRNLGWLGLSVADLFDPCKNLTAAQTVLADCYTRAARSRSSPQVALQAALSCYNTGNFTRGFANGYVAKVAGRVGAASGAERPNPEPIGRAEALGMRSAEQGLAREQDQAVGRPGDVFGQTVGDAFSGRDQAGQLPDEVILRNSVTLRQAIAGE